MEPTMTADDLYAYLQELDDEAYDLSKMEIVITVGKTVQVGRAYTIVKTQVDHDPESLNFTIK